MKLFMWFRNVQRKVYVNKVSEKSIHIPNFLLIAKTMRPTGSPITDPGKVDTYYNYNGWKNSKVQATILFHMKVHFVWIDKNHSIYEDHGYFVDQSQKQFFNNSG